MLLKKIITKVQLYFQIYILIYKSDRNTHPDAKLYNVLTHPKEDDWRPASNPSIKASIIVL